MEEVRIETADDFKGRLKIGETTKITAVVIPENATYRDVTWSSSAPEVAEVDSNGIITAKAAGKVIIDAKTDDGKESFITVKVVSEYHDVVIWGVVILLVASGMFFVIRRVIGRFSK